jgi:hypothetical protein
MSSKSQDESILGQVLDSLQIIIQNQGKTNERLDSIEQTLDNIRRNEIIIDKDIATLYSISSSLLSRSTDVKQAQYLIEQRIKALEDKNSQ